VKATAQYSDAVSLQPYGEIVDTTFHNRASEDRDHNGAEVFQRRLEAGAITSRRTGRCSTPSGR
jgi:hypothetical protein